jgi:hypothetical protein
MHPFMETLINQLQLTTCKSSVAEEEFPI